MLLHIVGGCSLREDIQKKNCRKSENCIIYPPPPTERADWDYCGDWDWSWTLDLYIDIKKLSGGGCIWIIVSAINCLFLDAIASLDSVL